MDVAQLREWLATRLVIVTLHDCDEYTKGDVEVRFSHGQAKLVFRDFISPFCKELKLRSDVFPTKK